MATDNWHPSLGDGCLQFHLLRRNLNLRRRYGFVANDSARFNSDRARRFGGLHDDLRESVEQRPARLLVTLMAIGITVADADKRALAGDFEVDHVLRRRQRATCS